MDIKNIIDLGNEIGNCFHSEDYASSKIDVKVNTPIGSFLCDITDIKRFVSGLILECELKAFSKTKFEESLELEKNKGRTVDCPICGEKVSLDAICKCGYFKYALHPRATADGGDMEVGYVNPNGIGCFDTTYTFNIFDSVVDLSTVYITWFGEESGECYQVNILGGAEILVLNMAKQNYSEKQSNICNTRKNNPF